MQEIVIESFAGQTFRTALNGLNTNFRIYWVEDHYAIKDADENHVVNGSFFMDVTNDLFTINGIRLVTDMELMQPYAINGFGGFVVFDTQEQRIDVSFEELGGRFALLYIEVDELDAVRASIAALP